MEEKNLERNDDLDYSPKRWIDSISPLGLIIIAVVILTAALGGILGLSYFNNNSGVEWWLLPLLVTMAAMGCEFIDSSLGMGYGTTLTPILLLAGFAPIEVVPAVLLSELCTGLLAGLLHQYEGNLNLLHDGRARLTTIILAALSIIGASVAALLAIKISAKVLGTMIGVIVLVMGLFILVTMKRSFQFHYYQVVILGAIASFNKGLSGGGYGPLVTGGQVICGVAPKQAVGITSLAEAGTCLVALVVYLCGGHHFNLTLLWPMLLGGILSVPFSVITIKKLSTDKVRLAIGVGTFLLGLLSLGKIWI